ncbi:hypothetical protein ACTNFJ_09355 [Leucobacter sp. W1153]
MHEQIKKFHKRGATDIGGFWISSSDNHEEGTEQIFIPEGAVILFTRLEDSPQEANLVMYWPDGKPE